MYVISTYILSLGSTVLDNILTIVMMYALVHVYGNIMLCVLSLELDLDTVTFFLRMYVPIKGNLLKIYFERVGICL